MNLLLHPEIDAGISINECKLLASFPESFDFIGGYKEQWARIGNSVPPNLMRAIAEHIKENILEKVK